MKTRIYENILILLLSAMITASLALSGCKHRSEKVPTPEAKPPVIADLESDYMRLEIQDDPFDLRVYNPEGVILLQTAGNIEYTIVKDVKVKERIAWYFISDGKAEPWTRLGVVSMERKDGRLIVKLGAAPSWDVRGRLTAYFADERTLRVETEVVNCPGANRVMYRFKKSSDDNYYGMGERFYSAEHSGETVRNWSEEGGLGINGLAKISKNISFNPFPHGKDTTYFPVPFFVNTRGYGFLLDDTHYATFDFGDSEKSELKINNWNGRFDFMVFYGPEPLKVIESMTEHTGRYKVPQPWVFAPWNVAVGGSERVREVAKMVREENIPTSAIWSEDWWWTESGGMVNRSADWELARSRYPDYEELAAELDRGGIRFLGYFQPYLFKGSELYEEAARKEYLTKSPEGGPAVVKVTFGEKGQLDVTNPEAAKWWREKFFRRSVEWGVDGWMTDFGEYTPPYSESYDGRDGWAVHNEYPVLWAKMNREFFERARPDGDYVFFVRGGYTGSWKYAPVMWTGDSNTNWGKLDGLPSVIPAVTSVGISGFPVTATDIAGYHCLTTTPTGKELFIRWAQLGAMLPVMRNHRGFEPCHNWPFDGDRETLEIYGKFARLHTRLFPYLYTLVHRAAERGWPVVRHMMLHYPEDAQARETEYQFLFGDRVLVAPVIEKGAKVRKVYFPEGRWVDYFTGDYYEGPGTVRVPVKLDYMPIFVKAGTLLPLFDSQIDTLVYENRDDLAGFDDANKSMKVVFYGTGGDEYTLWDGTRVKCSRPDEMSEGKCSVTGAPLGRDYSFEFK